MALLSPHWTSPGTHIPLHAPWAHPNGQGWVSCQVPSDLHVWTPSPVHCFDPAAHAPEQTPAPVHWNGHVVVVFHVPLGSHVCAALPLHRLPCPAQGPPLGASSLGAPPAPPSTK
jgi:hypothetical protein